MSNISRRAVEWLAEWFGLHTLLALLVPIIFYVVVGVAFQLDNVLDHAPSRNRAMFPVIELTVIPLSALAAARWRLGTNRLSSLRESVIGSYLPLLMAATLAGLIVYLGWSWRTPLTTVGPDDFGLVRWLGTVLAAAFTIVWLSLFPRITATLSGMIAGPMLFALVGYSFFGSQMQMYDPGGDGPGGVALAFGFLGTLVWLAGANCLCLRVRECEVVEVVRRERHPLAHAVWSGAVMLSLAVLGPTFEHFWN